MDVLVGNFCDYLGRIESKAETTNRGFWIFGLYKDAIFSREAESLGGIFYKFPTEEEAKLAYENNGDESFMTYAKPYARFCEFGYVELCKEDKENNKNDKEIYISCPNSIADKFATKAIIGNLEFYRFGDQGVLWCCNNVPDLSLDILIKMNAKFYEKAIMPGYSKQIAPGQLIPLNARYIRTHNPVEGNLIGKPWIESYGHMYIINNKGDKK